jgi:hypothetical protein
MRSKKPKSAQDLLHRAAKSTNGPSQTRDLRRILGTTTANVTRAIFVILMIWFVGSCSKPEPSPQRSNHDSSIQSGPVSGADSKRCLEAAIKELGSNGIVLRCGQLTNVKSLEAVVAVRVPGLKDDRNGIPISELRILREDRSQWESELNIDREVTNGAGYLGVDFIDDSHAFPFYRINFTDRGARWGSRAASQFTLVLFSMSRDGRPEPGDMGLGIGWNPLVGRYQELEPNGEEFAPEVKVPKHIKGY